MGGWVLDNFRNENNFIENSVNSQTKMLIKMDFPKEIMNELDELFKSSTKGAF